MALFRSKAEAKVAEAGYDPARLPPGQYLTEKWPVLHAGSVPDVDLAAWDLTVDGEVENPLTLTWEQLLELPSREVTVDIHCVTRWSRFDTTFKGVHWTELAKLAEPKAAGRYVVAHAAQGFTANLPLEAIEDENALIAYEADGEPLTADYAGPFGLGGRARCFRKSAKWLSGLEPLAHDAPRFWERYGYHSAAHYRKEPRYRFCPGQRRPEPPPPVLSSPSR